MSDLYYQVPCGCCGGYYGHAKNCTIHSESGVFEKIVTREVEQRFIRKHQDLIRKTQFLESLLRESCERIEKFKYFCQLIQGEKSERFLAENEIFLNNPEIKAILGEGE